MNCRNLILRIDDRLIERVRKIARQRGQSISQLVAAYFALLDTSIENDEDEIKNLPPITRELLGSLAGADVDEEDYRRYLLEKYG